MSKATRLLKKASELVKDKNYQEAVDVYLQASEAAPGDSRAWFGLGVCLYKVGNLEVARIALERADKMGYPRAQEALARVEQAEQRRAEQGSGARATGARREEETSRQAPKSARPVVRPEAEKISLEQYLRIMLVENIESDRRAIIRAIEGTIKDTEVSPVDYGVSTSDTMSGTVHYDAAVLDWDSDPDAAEGLIQILKIKRPSLFVVCLTEQWDAETVAQIVEAGGDYHLAKEENFAVVLPLIIAQWARRDRAIDLRLRAKVAENRQEEWPQALDALGEMLMLVAPDLSIVQANQAAMKGFRMGEDEFLGKPYAQVLYGSENPPESCPFLESMEVGKPAECEVHHEELSKQFMVHTWPVVAHTGKVAAVIGMLREKSAGEVSDDVRAREKFYRNLTERANAGIAMIGPDGAIQYANERLCTMVDYTIDELLDRPVESIVAPEDQEGLRECLAAAVDAGQAEGRLKLERSDAATLPTEARFGRLRAGGETSLALTFVEVEGLVEAEQEMWADMKELNSILDEGIDKLECAVTVLDEEGRITWLNSPAAVLLGEEREDLMDRPYLECLSLALDSHQVPTDDFLSALERAYEDTEPLEDLDLPLVMGNGDALRYWSTPVHGPSSGVARVEHIYTAQKQVVRDAAAEATSDLPPGLAEAVPDMLFSTGPEGQITWCNPAAVATAGYDMDNLRGMGLTDLAAEESRNKVEYLVKNALNSCRRVEGEEILLSRGDGRPFWAELTLLPTRNGQTGTAQGLHGSLRDVTERKINEAIHSMLENGVTA